MHPLKGGVAVFDSGIGGLTVLSACRQYCPEQSFYYYGDNLRAPYGNLTEARIREYARELFDAFEALNVSAAVIACNTVTAVCIDWLRARYTFPIIGAEPAVLPAMCHEGETLVLATNATCQSVRFQKLCQTAQRLHPNARLRVVPCCALAGEIEKHIHNPDYDFTSYLPEGAPNSVVLGCTHYVYIKEKIERFYSCPVFDGNVGIARRLSGILSELNAIDRDGQPLVTSAKIEGALNVEKSYFLDIYNPYVYFIGASASVNKSIYEQMFGKLDK